MASKPKRRALTELLKAAGDAPTIDSTGRKRPKNQILADMMWEFAVQGKVTFPNGTSLQASVRDWRDAASWIYTHSDGPAKPDISVDLTGLDRQLAESSSDELKRLIGEVVPVSELAALLGPGYTPGTSDDDGSADGSEVSESAGDSPASGTVTN